MTSIYRHYRGDVHASCRGLVVAVDHHRPPATRPHTTDVVSEGRMTSLELNFANLERTVTAQSQQIQELQAQLAEHQKNTTVLTKQYSELSVSIKHHQ